MAGMNRPRARLNDQIYEEERRLEDMLSDSNELERDFSTIDFGSYRKENTMVQANVWSFAKNGLKISPFWKIWKTFESKKMKICFVEETGSKIIWIMNEGITPLSVPRLPTSAALPNCMPKRSDLLRSAVRHRLTLVTTAMGPMRGAKTVNLTVNLLTTSNPTSPHKKRWHRWT